MKKNTKNLKKKLKIYSPKLKEECGVFGISNSTDASTLAALGLPLTVYLPPFYEGPIGLSVGTVGIIFMVARFWDIFTDPLMGALAVGAAGLGLATAAYVGWNLLHKRSDVSVLNSLLNTPIISFLPKTQTVETPKFLQQYIHCIDTTQLFRLLLERPELMRSKSLYKILKTVSEMGKDMEDLQKTLRKLETNLKLSVSDDSSRLMIDKTTLSFTKNKHLKDLEGYLLSTAKEAGKEALDIYEKEDKEDKEPDEDLNMNAKDTPYLAVKNVNWFDVILTGEFDEGGFSDAVDEILRERGSYNMIDKEEIREFKGSEVVIINLEYERFFYTKKTKTKP